MKLSMLPFKDIASSKLPNLIFLILLNFLFSISISIVNANISKITQPNSSQLINPVINSSKPRTVVIIISRNKRSPHEQNGKRGKGNGEEDGKGRGKGKGKGKWNGKENGKGNGEGSGKDNGKENGKGNGKERGNGEGNEGGKNSNTKNPKNGDVTKDPKDQNNPKNPKDQSIPKNPKALKDQPQNNNPNDPNNPPSGDNPKDPNNAPPSDNPKDPNSAPPRDNSAPPRDNPNGPNGAPPGNNPNGPNGAPPGNNPNGPNGAGNNPKDPNNAGPANNPNGPNNPPPGNNPKDPNNAGPGNNPNGPNGAPPGNNPNGPNGAPPGNNPNGPNNPPPGNSPKDPNNAGPGNNPNGPNGAPPGNNPKDQNNAGPANNPNGPNGAGNNPNDLNNPPPGNNPNNPTPTNDPNNPTPTYNPKDPNNQTPTNNPYDRKNYQIYYEDIYPDLHIHGAVSYPDGPVILRLSKNGSSTCKQSNLYLKLVYDVSTMNWINFTSPIPDFNFCSYGVENQDLIRIFPLRKKEFNEGFFLVSYLEKTENGNYNEIGIIMDWNGTVHSQLELSYIGITNTDISELGKAIVNNDPRRGFIWVNRINNDTIQWRKYSPNNVGNKYDAQGDLMTAKIFEGHKFGMFPTLDGGYGYVTVGKNPNVTTTTPPPPGLLVNPTWIANVVFIRPNSGEIMQPSLIYSSTLAAIDMNVELCDNAYDSPGLACIISVRTDNNRIYYIKIGFLSNGSTGGPVQMDIDSNNATVDHIYPLYHGGYVVTAKLKNVQKETLTGYIYNGQGANVSEWNFPRIIINSTISYGIYPNNTAWIFADGRYDENSEIIPQTLEMVNNSGRTMLTTDIPTLTKNGYNNLNVNVTSPQIDGQVEIGKTGISITYNNPVSLSAGNISIYQHDSATYRLMLRQSYSANAGTPPYVNQSQDKKTLTFSVLSSTFNMYNNKYTVVVDDNAVRDLSSQEPLLGIIADTWKFSTKENDQKQLKTTEHALIRLTYNASDYFSKGLSRTQQSEFVNLLSEELSQSVPIPKIRLYADSHYQWDPEVDSRQILLKFKISPGENDTEMNTDTVISTLNTMIKSEEISPISHLPRASMLDSKYGFVLKRSVWDKYEFKLFAVGATLLLLGILAIVSYKKNEDGNSFVAFRILLIALDFVLDFAFVVTHSKDVYYLYYPSLLTFIIPVGFNTLITFFIIIRELSNNKLFYKWFRTYHNVAAIFTFCSIVDVNSLTMMNSKLASLTAFDAPISPTTENWIFRVSIWNFIIEDTPHLIIQIIYIIESVNYDIIPFLNLMSSSLLWISILCGFIYRSFLYWNERRKERILEQFTVEYTDLNDGEGSGDNEGKEDLTDNNSEIRSVEYVLTTPLEEISPATIRPPSWWLDTGTSNQQGYMTSNIEDEGNNIGDYETLERRSSLPSLGQFGIAGPSAIYDRTRSGSNDISYGMIGSEHENTNTNTITITSASGSGSEHENTNTSTNTSAIGSGIEHENTNTSASAIASGSGSEHENTNTNTSTSTSASANASASAIASGSESESNESYVRIDVDRTSQDLENRQI